MKTRTVRVDPAGHVNIGREFAGAQFDLVVHDDGRIEFFPFGVVRRAELPDSVRHAIDKMSGKDSATKS